MSLRISTPDITKSQAPGCVHNCQDGEFNVWSLQARLPATNRALLQLTLANLQNSSIFRRNYVFLGAVFVSAFAFEIAFDTGADKIWDTINRGRQWKDIRHKYIEQE